MKNNGYGKTCDDHCVFIKKLCDFYSFIILLYVNNMLIIGHDTKIFKAQIN